LTIGRMSPQAALARLVKCMREGEQGVDWFISGGVFRELEKLKYDVDDVWDCFLDDAIIVPEHPAAATSRNRGVPRCAGWHYEYRTQYLGRDMYLKIRVTPEDLVEVTSFKPYGQAY
jgi:hypothetical protein